MLTARHYRYEVINQVNYLSLAVQQAALSPKYANRCWEQAAFSGFFPDGFCAFGAGP